MYNIFEYLEKTSAELPHKPAFTSEKEDLTFSELYNKSLSVGTALYSHIKRKNTMVLILADKTPETVVGMMGVIASGSAYVPLDPKTPLPRLTAIAEQVLPSAVLYGKKSKKTAESLALSCPAFEISSISGTVPDEKLLSDIRESVLDIDPAYMIFTSGSTGTPKGIPVSHRALIDFTEWLTSSFGISANDILADQAPFYFDTSVKNIYPALAVGCTTHILEQKLFMFPLLLIDELNKRKVTALIWSTSAFRLVAESGVFEKAIPETVKKIAVGGEALLGKHLNIWKKALPSCSYTNHYGPTEVTVDCTYYNITRDFANDESVPIGKASRNMEVFLLTEDGRRANSDEIGEIVVRGSGLALGYYKDPEKTARSFTKNPLTPEYPDIIYRTGDIGRLDSDGNITFISRKDEQIKHMGYRIELGEIENVIASHPSVESVACIFDSSADRIVCYVSSAEKLSSISEYTSERLPKYMLPNVWVTLSPLPLNRNGKIDRVYLSKKYMKERENQ